MNDEDSKKVDNDSTTEFADFVDEDDSLEFDILNVVVARSRNSDYLMDKALAKADMARGEKARQDIYTMYPLEANADESAEPSPAGPEADDDDLDTARRSDGTTTTTQTTLDNNPKTNDEKLKTQASFSIYDACAAGEDVASVRKQRVMSYVGSDPHLSFKVDSNDEEEEQQDGSAPLPPTSLVRNQRLRIPSAPPGAYAGGPGSELRRQEKVPFPLVGLQPVDNIHESTASLPEIIENGDLEEGNNNNDQLVEDHNTTTSNDRNGNKKCCIKMILIVVVAALAILVAVILGVILATDAGSGSTNESPDNTDNAQPPANGFILLDNVFGDQTQALPQKTIEAIQSGRRNRPQIMALEWISGDPKLDHYSIEQKLQRFALGVVYFATNGPQWFDNETYATIPNPWLAYDLHECEWFSLAPSQLQEPCYNYTNLDRHRQKQVDYRSLVLSGNPTYTNNGKNPVLQGTLPPQVGLLSNLQTLDLGHHQRLAGSIPTELVDLSATLRDIVLEQASYTGTIPDTIYEFPRVLRLDRNKRLDGGTVPSTVGLNSHLEQLSLVETNREGVIPTELFQATNLERLYLNENSITGTVPTEIGLLGSSLQEINLGLNRLTGWIPSEVGLLHQLSYFLMGANRFNGMLPTEMGLLQSLDKLELTKNQITGPLPSNLGSLTKLSYLDLSENRLRGTLPPSLSHLAEMIILDLGFNRFEGPLQLELFSNTNATEMMIATWPKLELLRLASNRMSGAIPSEIGFLRSLRTLNLQSNNFESLLPSELGNLESLEVFLLRATDISGLVPEEICSLPLESFMVECDQLKCPAGCPCTCA